MVLQKGRNQLGVFLLQWHNVDLSDVKEMEFQKTEIEKYSVQKNDILICEGGYLGRAAIWNNDYSIMFQKALHRVRFIDTCLSSRLFTLYLNLIDSTRFIVNYFIDSGIQHFTGKSLNKLVVPFPPLEEQKAIVEKVETLMRNYQALEQEIQTSEANAQMLMQAVLKEAFEGKQEAVEG